MRLPRAALPGLLLAAGLVFRVAIASSFSTSSPDADQYHALARSILRDGRYAYGPPPAPLTYSRLPGYPLVLAAIDRVPRSREVHGARAALANAVFDVLTAAVLAAIAFELEQPAAAPLAIAGVLVAPTIILWSVHALAESLATLLGVVELFFLVRYSRRGGHRHAVAAGIVAGAAQLVRFDALTLLAPAALAFLWAPGSSGRRLRAAALFAATALLVFSPWPLRNAYRFGALHAEGTEWLRQDGTPLPAGPIAWMRTWSTSAPGDTYLADLLVFGTPFSASTPGVLLPRMYDSSEERLRLSALLDRAGSVGLDAATSEGFARLARERTVAHPLRTFVELPLKRLPRLLLPPPRDTIRWVRIPLLDWPRSYALYPVHAATLHALALLGAVVLAWSGRWRIAALLLAGVLARMAVHSVAVPHQVGARYFVESIPMLVIVGALGAGVLLDQARAWWRRRRRSGTDVATI